jgi:hypothetical protein
VKLRRLLDGKPERFRHGAPVVVLGRRVADIVEQAHWSTIETPAVFSQ